MVRNSYPQNLHALYHKILIIGLAQLLQDHDKVQGFPERTSKTPPCRLAQLPYFKLPSMGTVGVLKQAVTH